MHCIFCDNDHYPQGKDKEGSDLEGEVVLTFDSGRAYRVPVNLPHLIISHEYSPPPSLIGDLMGGRHVVDGVAYAPPFPVVVGENYPQGGTPASAAYRLRDYIAAALKARHES